VDFTDLQGEMDMVGHAAEGMNAEIEPLHSFLKQKIEATAIGLIEKDGIAGVAAQDHMVKGAGVMDSRFAGHSRRIDENV
jgi:hypothetical protein